jgi:nicotinamide mononucleotide transporter
MVLFTLGNAHVTVAELLGFVTGAASVWLTVHARISHFPIGIANSAFFLVLFMTARLYADSGLQVVVVTRASRWPLAACAVFVIAATWGLTVLLRAAHDIAPFWIAADLIYIPLYVVKRLDLTALVHLLFLGLCGGGVTAWRRGLQAGQVATAGGRQLRGADGAGHGG